MTAFWVALLRPFLALLVLGLICLPVRLAAKRYLPEGRLKSLLLLPLRRKNPAVSGNG